MLVSIDYRLAPEVKLPAIIEDLKDAFTWIREKGPPLFHANPEKLVVSGGSAGGYLALMSGICVEPRPTALVAYCTLPPSRAADCKGGGIQRGGRQGPVGRRFLGGS